MSAFVLKATEIADIVARRRAEHFCSRLSYERRVSTHSSVKSGWTQVQLPRTALRAEPQLSTNSEKAHLKTVISREGNHASFRHGFVCRPFGHRSCWWC